jgi:prepilin-type N-terminal cleavage/methylation domain-containing protein
MPTSAPFSRRAFTFIEVAVVIIIIGILAAVVVPRFGTVTDEARTAAVQGTLGGVRASIAGFRTARVLAGGVPFPTLQELTTPGVVLDQVPPPNPFTGAAGVQTVSANQAAARSVSNTTQFGWNYYVNNAASPPVAIFYANSQDDTTLLAADGSARKASGL